MKANWLRQIMIDHDEFVVPETLLIELYKEFKQILECLWNFANFLTCRAIQAD